MPNTVKHTEKKENKRNEDGITERSNSFTLIHSIIEEYTGIVTNNVQPIAQPSSVRKPHNR